MEMRFKNYCIVVLGDTIGVIPEIVKVSEIEPNTLDAKGVLIATFASTLSPAELTAWFTERRRSFFVFDLSEKSSGVNIVKESIHEGLFGFLKTIDTDGMTEKFLRAIEMSSDTKTSINSSNKKTSKTKELTEQDIEKMSDKERTKKLDELLDIGIENLSISEKKLLPLLAK